MNTSLNNWNNSRKRPGIVLLVTLVLLVVLSTLGYTLSSRVAAQRHRNQYIIDYSEARYGCDSAVKYALVTLEEIDARLISRPNEPDFSDLFALSEVEYQELLTQWNIEFRLAGNEGRETFDDMIDIENVDDLRDSNDANDIGADEAGIAGFDDPGSLTIPGPYGPPWPFVTEPIEFEIGSAKVRIEIEDENAKYPLAWALLDVEQLKQELPVGLVIFCEWMGLDVEQIGPPLRGQLIEIGAIKPFKLDFKPITRTVKTPAKATTATGSKGRPTRVPPPRPSRKVIPASQQIAEQTTHFARVFHSSLIDTETLARPTVVSRSRRESPLKYMGIWGSRQVNINTAPRHVLEATFIFGGDEVEIAEEIILRRREQVFTDIKDLRTRLLRYSESIGKCERYITMVSTFFTIRVTAVSGVAKASSVIAITKNGERVQRIAVING